MATGILIFAEVGEGKLKKTTFELLSKAKALNIGGETSVALLGHKVENLAAELKTYGADKIWVVDHEKLAQYSSSAYAKALHDVVKKSEPQVLLATASPVGQDLLPKVGARLGVPVASGCTEMSHASDGRLEIKRPLYAGKALASVNIPNATPQIVTCRPNSFPIKEEAGSGNIEKLSVEFAPQDLTTLVKDVVKGAADKIDLTEANIIISGGRSLENQENFKILEELAQVLNAAVGASRAAVDAGYAPHAMQVGQTGKTVNPSLYIACGISGAIQHLAGMRTSKVIVAINKDPEAPIFKLADYGIVDDLFKVVPLMTAHFKEMLSQ